MSTFLLGLIIFFTPHLYSAFRSREDDKDLRQKFGYAKYMGFYSVISLIGFYFMITGFVAMRPAPILYDAPSWGKHANILLSIIALIPFVASQMPAGHIKQRLKHPMLISIKIWALGHLLANGELNSVLLFGAFLAFAVIDRIAVKRRGDMGAAQAEPDVKWDILALVIGLSIALLIAFYLHPILFGVAALPTG